MWGKATLVSISGEEVYLQIQEHFRPRWKKLAQNQPTGKPHTLELHVAMEFERTEKPGIVVFRAHELPDLYVQQRYPAASKAQQRTFWGICYFLGWCDEGHKPNSETQYWIREGLIAEYSPWVTNPATGKEEPMRPSDPRMTTKEMAKLIQGALAELAQKDVPQHVEDAIGSDMHHVWKEWYEWRWSQKIDPLQEYAAQTWEDFVAEHQVCMACGQGPKDSDPLERQHIVSVGSDKALEEAPWNWLYTHRSHHTYQHGKGWQAFIEAFPHLGPRISRAHEKATEKQQQELF
jgi:hypothetical protein